MFEPSVAGFTKWLANDPYPSSVYYSTPNCTEQKHLHHWVPAVKPLYTDWEMAWDGGHRYSFWARHNIAIAFACCAVYLGLIVFLKRFMQNRPYYDVRVAQVAWNVLLAVFSTCGALRTMPYLLMWIYQEGWVAAMCTSPVTGYGGIGPTAFWTCLFIFSKVPELLDTMFILLAKKDLLFLHAYHHVTVLLFCWHSYATRSSAGIFFVAMNFTVHAIMYSYYALQGVVSLRLSSAKRNPDKKVGDLATVKAQKIRKVLGKTAPFITALQIGQMIGGMAVLGTIFIQLQKSATSCDISRTNWLAGLVMYFSYFVLFVMFAIERYICPSKKTKSE